MRWILEKREVSCSNVCKKKRQQRKFSSANFLQGQGKVSGLCIHGSRSTSLGTVFEHPLIGEDALKGPCEVSVGVVSRRKAALHVEQIPIERFSEGYYHYWNGGPGSGAKNLKEFWHNLTHGIESLSTFSDEDLIESGVDVGSIRNDSNFAKVDGVLSWKMS